jgi:hypothetical protein
VTVPGRMSRYSRVRILFHHAWLVLMGITESKLSKRIGSRKNDFIEEVMHL